MPEDKDEAEQTASGTTDAIIAVLKALKRDEIVAIDDTRAVTGESAEGKVLAYAALEKAASTVVGAVTRDVPAVLLVVEEEVGPLAALTALDARLTVARQGLEEATHEVAALLNPPDTQPSVASVASVAAIAAPLISAGLTIASLFRTETKISHAEVSLDNRALVAAAARQLLARTPPPRVLIPTLARLRQVPATSPLLARISEVDGMLRRAAGHAARLAQEIALADKEGSSTSAERRSALADAKARLDAATKTGTTLIEGLGGLPDGKEDMTVLSLALQGEMLREALGQDGRILALKALGGSGSTRADERFLRDDKVTHAGAAIVTFTLFDREGTVLAAGVEHSYSGFLTEDDIPRR